MAIDPEKLHRVMLLCQKYQVSTFKYEGLEIAFKVMKDAERPTEIQGPPLVDEKSLPHDLRMENITSVDDILNWSAPHSDETAVPGDVPIE